jgi:GNAT superfamily N-acetyltransferase
VEAARTAGIVFGQATPGERDWLAAHALEHWYQRWDEYFAASAPENILVGRLRDRQLVAALIVGFPGQVLQWQPMLGPQVTTIGCVGTLRPFRGQGIGTALVAAASEMLKRAGGSVCHIGWTDLLTFYGRLGYVPWRSYARATRNLHLT